MNYYTQGGQARGIKSLAQELPKYGRDGDTMVAHINPEEAAMLKAMGGSGTINPATGLPEFKFNPIKIVRDAVVKPVQAVYNATLKNIPGVDQALVGLDKTVGSTIPGGWNTLAQTALAFTPLGLPAKVGLAALGGSGALSPNGKFNLQRAILSGAMAYGANQLAAGLSEAGGAAATGPQALGDAGGAGFTSAAEGAGGSVGGISAGGTFLPSAGSGASFVVPEAVSAAAPEALGNYGGAGFTSATPSFKETLLADIQKTGQNLSSAGRGIKNLSGFGPEGLSGVGPAATKFAEPVTSRGLTALGVGTLGLSEMDAQQDMMKSQQNAQNNANSDYNQQMAIIESNRKRGEDAMRANPYQFAAGGEVPSFLGGGMPPRFLSGGGDGMSDSIKANISGKQEARLADGEFVIPADVVSHIGNGSSKAGAKQLYSMMDRVRRERTGNPKQGKQINPRKLMPA